MKTTNRDLLKQAHKEAKANRKENQSYREALSIAMKNVYGEYRMKKELDFSIAGMHSAGKAAVPKSEETIEFNKIYYRGLANRRKGLRPGF